MGEKRTPKETETIFKAMAKAMVSGKPNPMYQQKAELIVMGEIDGTQKQVVLSRDKISRTIYNITIDGEYLGQVLHTTAGWGIYPIEGSWLKGKNCDFILNAVINAENIET
jgi:hypothetical protein